ncbi:MAG: AsmA family protein [Nitrospirota bacterium]|nr:MAG: AsmA family protein [Nitrospirota bacterium]
MEDDRELPHDGKTMPLRIVMKWLGIGLLILIAILTVFIWTFDLNDYREPLAASASRAIGAAITFDGPINVDLSFQPRFVAERIHIANPEWASRSHLLLAERVEIEISLLPLLKGKVELPNVRLTNLDLLLEEGSNGSRNWVFGNSSQPMDTHNPKTSPSSTVPRIELLTIQNSKIGYRSYESDSPFNVDISEASTSLIPDEPVRLLIDGRIRGEPLSLEIITATLQEFVAPVGAWPLKATLTHPGASLLADGTVSNQLDMVDLAFDLSGDRLDTLTPLLKEDLPPLGPYFLRGRIANSESEWHLADLNLRVNQTEITGNAQASRPDPSKNFEIDLTSKTFFLDDFFVKKKGPPTKAPAGALGDVQIPVGYLRDLIARAGIKIEELRLNDQMLGSVSLDAKVRDGLLEIGLRRTGRFRGKARLDLKLDVREKEPTVRIEGKGVALDYGRGLKALRVTDVIQGKTDATLLFTGRGKTLNQVLKSSIFSIKAGPSVLTYMDPDTGSKRRIDVSVLTGSIYPGKSIKFGLNGRFRQKPLVVKMTGGPVRDFIDREKPWPIMISVSAADTSLLAKGDLTRAPEGFKVSLTAGIKGDRISFFDPELPPLGPYRVTAKINREEYKIVVSDVRAQFADTHLKGGLLINTSEPRPAIRGTLTSEGLRFEDVLKPTPGPLPVEVFQGFDLNIGVRATQAFIGKLDLSDFSADITLKNGLLTVSPIRGRLVFSEGKSSNLQGLFELKFAHPASTLTVQVGGRSWHYGQLLQKLEYTNLIRGTGDLQLVLKGKGTTIGTLLKDSSVKVQSQTKNLTVLMGDEEEEKIENVRLTLLSEKGKWLQLKGKGTIENIPVSIDLRSGATSTLFAKSGQWPIAGIADFGNLYFKVNGKLNLPLDGENFSGRALLKGKALKDLDLILPTSLPNLGPFEISATVADSKTGFDMTQINGRLQESELKGRLILTLKGPRPRVEGDFTSDRIVVPEFNDAKSDSQENEGAPESTQEYPVLQKVESGIDFIAEETRLARGGQIEDVEGAEFAEGGEQDESRGASITKEKMRVVPKYEFPIEALKMVDLDLGFNIKDVEVPPHEIGDVDFRIKLEDGDFALEPLQGTIWGGAVEGSFKIDARGEIPRIHLQTKIVGLDYGRLFQTLGVIEEVKGSADKIEVDLEGQGSTLREVLSQANGKVDFVEGEMEFEKKYIDLWAGDLITTLLTSAWETEEVSQFNCAVSKFDVENGIASSDEILFDTKRVTIAGVGTLDLGTEQIDVLLTPQPKDPTLLSLGHPVRISGPVAEPNVSAEREDLLKSAGWLTLGIAVPVLLPLAVPQVAGTSLGSGENPCEEALAGQPIKPVKSRERSFWDRITGFWKEPEEPEPAIGEATD